MPMSSSLTSNSVTLTPPIPAPVLVPARLPQQLLAQQHPQELPPPLLAPALLSLLARLFGGNVVGKVGLVPLLVLKAHASTLTLGTVSTSFSIIYLFVAN
jgi:hypothetical protein